MVNKERVNTNVEEFKSLSLTSSFLISHLDTKPKNVPAGSTPSRYAGWPQCSLPRPHRWWRGRCWSRPARGSSCWICWVLPTWGSVFYMYESVCVGECVSLRVWRQLKTKAGGAR